jgi:hypothetical protein
MLWSQNNISKTVGFILCIFIGGCGAFAQLVPVKDPAFRTKLCGLSPSVMDATCNQLDTIKALSANRNLIFNSANLSNVDEVVYFKNTDTLRVANNQLTSFPHDLSRFQHLQRLQLSNNQLTTAPNIHYVNAISGDTAIKLVYLLNNKITTIPASWNSYNAMTQVIDLSNNELQKIPTFINYPQIRRLDLRNNLIPIMQNPRWAISNISLFPQKPFPVKMDTLVKIGQVLYVSISSGLSSNKYTLLKDNKIIETNRTGEFTISIYTESDTGKYWFKIRNDNFVASSDSLQSEFKNVTLDRTNEKDKDVIIFSPNGDGTADVAYLNGIGQAKIINKNGIEIQNITLPYIWNGIDKKGQMQIPGLYYVQSSDGSVLKVLMVN